MEQGIKLKVKNRGKGYLEIPIREIIYYGKTKFQEVLIAKNERLGTFLALDGDIQSSEIDEFIYHEALVHPAMITHPNPEKILLLGGGEGSPVKEILKHPSVKHVDWVDIDGELVELCRKYLPYSWKGNDPRVSFYAMDGFEFIERAIEEGRKYDIIIYDLIEPEDGSDLADRLYSRETYEKLKNLLSEGGILVLMAWERVRDHWTWGIEELKKIFRIVRPYFIYVPSFSCEIMFAIASDKYDPIKDVKKDKIIEIPNLKFYSPEVYEGMFKIAEGYLKLANRF